MNNYDTDHFAYEALRALALTHNYNRWIYETFKPYVGKNVMEIGCGIGNMSKLFKLSCERLIGIDVSGMFLDHLRIDHPQFELYNYDITSDEVLELRDKNIDTVVCINVLEHVKDDLHAIANVGAILKPGGHFLLFLPALEMLYGSMDSNARHYRRYDKDSLCSKLTSNGFVIKRIFFSNILGIFGWFLNGKVLNRKRFPVLQTLLFDKLVPLIAVLERHIRLPFGMNIIAIAVKQ